MQSSSSRWVGCDFPPKDGDRGTYSVRGSFTRLHHFNAQIQRLPILQVIDFYV